MSRIHNHLAGKLIVEEEDVEVKFYYTKTFVTPKAWEISGKGLHTMTEARYEQLKQFAIKVLDLYIEAFNKPEG